MSGGRRQPYWPHSALVAAGYQHGRHRASGLTCIHGQLADKLGAWAEAAVRLTLRLCCMLWQHQSCVLLHTHTHTRTIHGISHRAAADLEIQHSSRSVGMLFGVSGLLLLLLLLT